MNFMYPRTNYEMTEAQLKTLLEACRATPVMMIGSCVGSSPQENANRAWESLGKEMGFDVMTVQPIPGKGNRFFTAIPSENDVQRTERLAKEEARRRELEISRLEDEIAERQHALDVIRARP